MDQRRIRNRTVITESKMPPATGCNRPEGVNPYKEAGDRTMPRVHPNIEDPNAYADFTVEVCDSEFPRTIASCVTGGLILVEYVIFIYPQDKFFKVSIKRGATDRDRARYAALARTLPSGEWSAIRHWQRATGKGRERYTQGRGTPVSLDFTAADFEVALLEAAGTGITVNELVARMASDRLPMVTT